MTAACLCYILFAKTKRIKIIVGFVFAFVMFHRMGVTPEIGTSRSGNLLLQGLIEGKKSYFCCISSNFSCPRRCSLIGWIIIKLTISVS